jgi:hypothetical protein
LAELAAELEPLMEPAMSPQDDQQTIRFDSQVIVGAGRGLPQRRNADCGSKKTASSSYPSSRNFCLYAITSKVSSGPLEACTCRELRDDEHMDDNAMEPDARQLLDVSPVRS